MSTTNKYGSKHDSENEINFNDFEHTDNAFDLADSDIDSVDQM